MVTMRDKSTIDTPMFSRGERLAHSVTALRAILRRVGRIHFDHLATGAFSLVRQDRSELTPSGVANALGEMMIFHHPFNIQIFDGDRVEFSHHIKRRLVVEIRALALNLLVLLRQQLDRLASAIASLVRTARDSALRRLQFSLRLAQEFGIFDNLARRERGEILDSDINANRVAGLGKESGLILFDGEDHIPAVRLALDHTGLDSPLDWAGETDATRAVFREMQLVGVEAKAALRIGEGIKARRGFESRIPRRFALLHAAKESVEGFIHAAKSVLKNLTVDRAHIFAQLLDLWELNGLGVVIDRKSVDLVGIASFLKRGVIQLAANVERRLKRRFKLRIGLQLVFVCLHFPDYTLVHMAKQQLQALYHCVFKLQYHLVVVTKYRRKVISEEMKKRLGEIFSDTLLKWECELIEFNGEADHVHLLFSATPKPSLSVLVNNLKTVSSRLIRKEFKHEVSKVYWKPVFWHRSYCLLTCGAAPLSVIKQYIQQQGEP